MDFVQIGNIVMDNLENEDKKVWLESQSDENNNLFVEVSNGDARIIRDFEAQAYSEDELIENEYSHGCYIYVNCDSSKEIVEKLEDSGFWQSKKHPRLSGFYLEPVA